MLKMSFYYKDEFNQTSRLTKTFTDSNIEFVSHFELLLDEFKKFLISSGFSPESVDKIQIIEDKN